MGITSRSDAMNTVMVDLSIPSDAFAVGSVLCGREDARVELAQFVPISESLIPYVWVETDDTDRFEECVRADDRVETLTAVGEAENRTLYKVAWADAIDGFLSAVADHDLLVKDATGTPERWQFRLQGPDHGNLSSFHETLREEGIPVSVRRVWNPTADDRTHYGLTEKQRETLKFAFSEGYFEVPRDASLTDLSETLDVSHQSVSRRMRGGLRNLLAATLMDES